MGESHSEATQGAQWTRLDALETCSRSLSIVSVAQAVPYALLSGRSEMNTPTLIIYHVTLRLAEALVTLLD